MNLARLRHIKYRLVKWEVNVMRRMDRVRLRKTRHRRLLILDRHLAATQARVYAETFVAIIDQFGAQADHAW